jgi:4-hydroxy-2-oxoheptanedioate aldolase
VRSSRIRSRLKNNQVARIACLYYPTAMMPAHAAHAGFDALWLDGEHNTWDRREIQRMLSLHHLADIDCIVRTGSRNPTELYRLLEDGATALLIPLVNSREEARALVQAVKFPPIGQRGVDGAGLDNGFGVHGREQYFAAANRETLLIIQIETPEAIAAIDEIASVPGLDGLFIGPGDLSLRLNCPMDWNQPAMKDAQARVAAAAAKHGIAWGRPARSVEDIRDLAAAGGRLIGHGSDYSSVAQMLPQFAGRFNEALGAASAPRSANSPVKGE